MKMTVRNLEVTKMLIIPKNEPTSLVGCFLSRNLIVYNGIKLKIARSPIESIRIECNRLFVNVNDEADLDDLIYIIEFNKHNFKANSVIIEKINNRRIVIEYLESIYKKETIGSYLGTGIVVTDFEKFTPI
jgi:hypothetical protein